MGAHSKLNRPIHVVDYDPKWPVLYEAEKTQILAALGTIEVRIEHFGSTSVPGLPAKPVIDISVGVADLELAQALIPILETLGYTYEPGFEQELPTRRFLWKGTPLVHTYHVSIEVPGSPVWEEHILFRNYLRRHPEAIQRYQELKRELAASCVTDMQAYVQGKTDFVLACVEKARQEAQNP